MLLGEQGQEERIPRDAILRISYHPNPLVTPGWGLEELRGTAQ